MIYQEVHPVSRMEADRMFVSGDSKLICRALISSAYYDLDREWVEERCEYFSKHFDPTVRGCAATCFGHLARIHGVRRLERALAALEELAADPRTAGIARDAIQDIHKFVGKAEPG